MTAMTAQTQTFAPIYMARNLGDGTAIDDLRIKLGLAPTDHAAHVTLAFSRDAVDWSHPAFTPRQNELVIVPDDLQLDRFDDGCIVLRFHSEVLHARWQEMRNAGASWDYPTYHSHITIGIDTTGELDLDQHRDVSIAPFTLGAEYREGLELD
jgi:uncharacterized protein